MEYPLSPIPKNPGIYALKNKKTGHVYIGQSVDLNRRHAEWRSCLVTGLGIKSLKVLNIIKETGHEHWVFVILSSMPDATVDQLNKCEDYAIERVRKNRPDKLVNTFVLNPINDTHPPPVQQARLSTITYEGNSISIGMMAHLLGAKKDTVKARLKKLRKAGIFEIKAEDWLARSKQWGRQKEHKTI